MVISVSGLGFSNGVCYAQQVIQRQDSEPRASVCAVQNEPGYAFRVP